MRRRHLDYPLLAIVLGLLAAGLLMISSASIALSEKNFGTPYYYVSHQAVAALAGLAVLFIFQNIPYRFWRRMSLPILLGSLAATAAVFIPQIGVAAKGAARWLDFGFGTIQPSEILKLSLILYLASWLEKKRGELRGFAASLVPFLIVLGAVGGLLAQQKDLGTLIITGGAAVLVYFLGGSRISQIVLLGVIALAAVAALIAVEPYRADRILVFLNPETSLQGAGYHANQAQIAIGSGGFWGRGFGQSIQKHNSLPEPMGDSIFAVIVEELGFLGGVIFIAAYFAFFVRGIVIARRAPDVFGRLLVSGLVSLITLQAFVNMAAISGILPLTGIPLPFVSYGGTALIITLAMAGIMLNVSKAGGR